MVYNISSVTQYFLLLIRYIYKLFITLCLWVFCLTAYLCTIFVPGACRSEKRSQFPGTEVAEVWAVMWVWGIAHRFSEKLSVCLTAELSFLPLFPFEPYTTKVIENEEDLHYINSISKPLTYPVYKIVFNNRNSIFKTSCNVLC